jgi:Ribbon-helix-helix protein, copG family
MTATMYNERVKTITITIPEDLDERAAAEARRRGISKSELIREGLGSVLTPALHGPGDDPWRSLAGFGAEDISLRPGEVDDVVYGQ